MYLFCFPDGVAVYLDDGSKPTVEGSTRTLDCEVEELHRLQIEYIYWMKNGRRLRDGYRYQGYTTRHLTINNLQTSDGGSYACRVKAVGKTERTSKTFPLCIKNATL